MKLALAWLLFSLSESGLTPEHSSHQRLRSVIPKRGTDLRQHRIVLRSPSLKAELSSEERARRIEMFNRIAR